MPKKNPYAKFGTFTKIKDTLTHSVKQYNMPLEFFFLPFFHFKTITGLQKL